MNSQDAIPGGLNFIKKHQLQSGGFHSYSSNNPDAFFAATESRSIFISALILSSLHVVHSRDSSTIQDAIARYLLVQKSAAWSWNYWDRQAQKSQLMKYPDDLDDSFCAASGLTLHDPSIFNGKPLAALAQLLIHNEAQEGGPYYTWRVDSTAGAQWRDVDVVVNSNIGYFLSLQGVQLPSITKLIDEAIVSSHLSSPYYPGICQVAYFVSRSYKGSQLTKLRQTILAEQVDDHWGNVLNTAMAVSSLLRIGQPPDTCAKSIKYILDQQQADGSWAAQAICIERKRDDIVTYAGAATLTTALCLEAIALFNNVPASVLSINKPDSFYQKSQNIRRLVRDKINMLPQSELNKQTHHLLNRIVKQDIDGQISLLPWLVARAGNFVVAEVTLQKLASLSLWGWMAYTTYDNFLDGAGEPKLLPSANFCLRQLTLTMQTTLTDNRAFQADSQHIMDRMDAANAWEVSNCRPKIINHKLYLGDLPDYKDYWQLADRSLGHTIAGLGVLYAAGEQTNSANMTALRNFFKHYLIARQLNDDAHDWEEDLLFGHVNSVAVLLLRNWRYQHPKSKIVDLNSNMAALRLALWNEVIEEVGVLILKHIATARAYLQPKDVVFNEQILNTVLIPLEKTVHVTIAKRADASAFIKAL